MTRISFLPSFQVYESDMKESIPAHHCQGNSRMTNPKASSQSVDYWRTLHFEGIHSVHERHIVASAGNIAQSG